MAEYQVSCINKQPRDNTHEGIQFLGGPGGGGWKTTRQKVVSLIEGGEHFYTLNTGKKAYLKVRVSAAGNKYVQTEADGVWQNNLLSLPECP